ncbi:hypothetical protein QYE76_000905 [Lolium multiflorum]|uniref:Uncharacterized protein n=1 Tax=Lolium multiflorum TaxID=4521 RepID=A0AAD8RKS5_LOLMU|nr:hypothetical protein QYE76_000905 [Lolium multiflorum]
MEQGYYFKSLTLMSFLVFFFAEVGVSSGLDHQLIVQFIVFALFLLSIGISIGILACFLIRRRKRHNATTKITKHLQIAGAATLFRGALVEDELDQGVGGPPAIFLQRASYRHQ